MPSSMAEVPVTASFSELFEFVATVKGQVNLAKKLDALGGTLFRVRDAMVVAGEATEENNRILESSINNAKMIAKVQTQIIEGQD